MKIASHHQRQQLKFAKLVDRIAKGVIVGGGLLVILTVVAILLEIVQVAVPLFFSPAYHQDTVKGISLDSGQEVVAALGDEYMEVITLIDADGVAHLFNGREGQFEKLPQDFPILDAGRHLIAQVKNAEQVILQDDLGKIYAYQTKVRSVFDENNQRSQIPTPAIIANFEKLEGAENAGKLLSGGLNAQGDLYAIYLKNDRELWYEFQPGKSPGGLGGLSLGGASKSRIQTLILKADDTAGSLIGYQAAFDGDFKRLVLGGRDGQIHLIDLDRDSGAIGSQSTATFAELSKISALAFSLGGDSLLVGDDLGHLAAVFILREGTQETLKLAKTFDKHPAAIETIVPSRRSKQFFAYDQHGKIGFYFLTNERSLLNIQSEFRPQAIVLSPNDHSLLSMNRDLSKINQFELFIPHPEINFKALFSKVWYESYQVPAFVWQSTGGSDSFESKMSLIPLIFGTLKATFYAMLFALPVAVLSAIYTSQFMSQRYRKKLKPLIELMASIPSVVIGFLLALWLAPFLEEYLLAFFVFLLLVPLVMTLMFFALAKVPKETTLRKWTHGREFYFTVPIMVAAAWLAYSIGPKVELALFGGYFAQWLHEHLGMTYDQRNSIVVAIGLGFAVIPIIFSISDDSLSSVPANLSASSFAMGASRWQTVWRVVLPSASPGIFAASMIGFGRAVGETMIVLMATGNTPILDWNFFNGMRTLSANIAVEIPEAPVNGTLYRTLFLCAVILFLFTFSINTIAEIVRARLRKKYGRF